MNLYLVRNPKFTKGFTAGTLTCGSYSCFTLEDEVREMDGKPVEYWKIKGKTAIPRGEYRVDITFSNRFQKLLPILLNVKGFDGIRIHSGNTDKDTEGCILVGKDSGADGFLGQSREAFNEVYNLIRDSLNKGEDVYISVE